MVEKKDWKEFQKTGLLLIVNQFLHVFGWAIVMQIYDGEIVSVYPARVKFRGFGGKDTEEAYEKVSKYMKDNSDELYEEVKEA